MVSVFTYFVKTMRKVCLSSLNYSRSFVDCVLLPPFRGALTVGEAGRTAADCILQITFLVPGWEDAEEAAGQRRDYTDRNTNLREFRFSTPFARNNAGATAQSTDVLQQCKRNTQLFTAAVFPYLCTRQCVSHRAETGTAGMM